VVNPYPTNLFLERTIMSANYKDTINLPVTDFPMKAQLPINEPNLLNHWADINLFAQQRKQSNGREKFVLHDGPPYANGHLHIGHALNKILKDVINRTQQMLGKDANYVPGWDCHGLPIEWKIEEKYREKKLDKDQVPILEFRKECREFAEHWIEVQRSEFKRLGVLGDWANPYSTMTFEAEARIAKELCKFLMDGSLYKGAKPVMWSPVEKTALAEAEIEYYEHTSNTIYVCFPIITNNTQKTTAASIVIWTTTPWTIPGNRAIAYGPDIDYLVIQPTKIENNSLAQPGKKLVIAKARLDSFCKDCKILDVKILGELKGRELGGSICAHPIRSRGFEFDVPALAADFPTTTEGTGFVHIAPGHGADDWDLGVKHNIEVPDTVGEDGCFYDHIPLFAGMHVYKSDKYISEIINESQNLLGKGTILHRYPHSWRSKKPLIFRNTAQWFISMGKTRLREIALAAISKTRFVPNSGKDRLRGMIQTRPDWCVSRQRAWGVPIAVFVEKSTGKPLRDQNVIDRTIKIFEQEGADAWFASPPERFLGEKYDSNNFEQIKDILDVWFESGCTHTFCLEEGNWNLKWPASLYLEGTDQHRGWFHSSLLESCGTRKQAPYEAVLTHGFVMAEDGQKMSKSLGNIVSPQDIVDKYGADILRLWVVSSDYSEDLRIGPEIIKQQVDIYRRLRNTLRYILGNLHDFNSLERMPFEALPEQERWVLHRIWEMDKALRNACSAFEFHNYFVELHNFCTVDLSAFYFDVRKDALYCEPKNSPIRSSIRTVLDELFTCLTAWFAPFICFTAEEAWLSRNSSADPRNSIHLQKFPKILDTWENEKLAKKWRKIRQVRKVVTQSIEEKRASKEIGSSLQARPTIFSGTEYRDLFKNLDPAEIFITSDVVFKNTDPPEGAYRSSELPDMCVLIESTTGNKCGRCWKILEEVGKNKEHNDLCGRCIEAVKTY